MNKIEKGIEAIILGIGKKQGDAVIKAVDKKGLMNTGWSDIENEGGCWDIKKLAQEIYKNRKKLGLFTLGDIEIDETKLDLRWDILYDEDVDPVIKWWLNGKQIEVKCFKDLAKAIADKKPIKIKDK